MSGINSIKSTLKRLGDETKIEKRKRSVITFSELEEIQRTGIIPDDISEGGWLVVPGMMTTEEWLNADFSK
jgi:hypothetical protein